MRELRGVPTRMPGLTTVVAELVTLATMPASVNAAPPEDCSGGQIVATSQTLQGNWVAGRDKPCFTLRNGVNLDLAGFTIECPPENAPCVAAVVATATGSAVVDGHIIGPFVTAIENPERVTKLFISGAATGVSGQSVKKIDDSIFLDCIDCVKVNLPTSLSRIVNNYFRPATDSTGLGGTAVSASSSVTSGPGSQVERNFTKDHCRGFVSPGGGLIRFTKNIGGPMSSTVTADCLEFVEDGGESYSGNLCGDSAKCPDPVLPYVLP